MMTARGWISWMGACALVLSVGCGDENGTGTGGSTSGNTGATSTSTGKPALDPHYACVETNLLEAHKLFGPQFDIDKGGFLGTPNATYVVSTTQIYVDKAKEGAFINTATAVSAQLDQTDGVVAYALAVDQGCGVNRTLAVWESEAKMYKFVMSGAHATAMGQTTDLSITGRVTHWTATADEVKALTWDVARAKLDPVEPSGIYP